MITRRQVYLNNNRAILLLLSLSTLWLAATPLAGFAQNKPNNSLPEVIQSEPKTDPQIEVVDKKEEPPQQIAAEANSKDSPPAKEEQKIETVSNKIETEVESESIPEVIRVFNLTQSLDHAIANYLGIHIARLDREQVQAKLSETKALRFVPEAKVTTLFGPIPDVPDGSGPPDFPGADTSFTDMNIFTTVQVEVLQPILTFGRISHGINLAKKGVDAKRAAESEAKADLALNIKKTYYGLALVYSLQDHLSEIRQNLNKVSVRIKELLDNASSEVTESDRLKIDLFESDLTRRDIDASQSMQKLRYAYELLMGFEGGRDDWQIHDKKIRPQGKLALGQDDYLQWAKASNPELKQLALLVEIRRSAMEISKAQMRPFFFLGGRLNYAIAPGREDIENPFLVDDFNTFTGGVAFGLRQPLNFHVLNYRLRQRRIEYTKAKQQQRLAEAAILQKVRQGYLEATTFAEQLEVSKKGLKSGRAWLLAELQNFDLGLNETKETLEAFIAYARAKNDFLESVFKYNVALANLSRVTYREVTKLQYSGDGRS